MDQSSPTVTVPNQFLEQSIDPESLRQHLQSAGFQEKVEGEPDNKSLGQRRTGSEALREDGISGQ